MAQSNEIGPLATLHTAWPRIRLNKSSLDERWPKNLRKEPTWESKSQYSARLSPSDLNPYSVMHIWLFSWRSIEGNYKNCDLSIFPGNPREGSNLCQMIELQTPWKAPFPNRGFYCHISSPSMVLFSLLVPLYPFRFLNISFSTSIIFTNPLPLSTHKNVLLHFPQECAMNFMFTNSNCPRKPLPTTPREVSSQKNKICEPKA